MNWNIVGLKVMRWKVETYYEQKKRLSLWHTWFAWIPVTDEKGNWFWLEKVARKGDSGYGHWNWEYAAHSNLDKLVREINNQ